MPLFFNRWVSLCRFIKGSFKHYLCPFQLPSVKRRQLYLRRWNKHVRASWYSSMKMVTTLPINIQDCKVKVSWCGVCHCYCKVNNFASSQEFKQTRAMPGTLHFITVLKCTSDASDMSMSAWRFRFWLKTQRFTKSDWIPSRHKNLGGWKNNFQSIIQALDCSRLNQMAYSPFFSYFHSAVVGINSIKS